MLINILTVVHVLAAISMVVLVLLQQGRGADMGAAFGGGSQSLFGARGSANFLSRTTGLLAGVILFTSLGLAFIYNQPGDRGSVTDTIESSPGTALPSEAGDADATADSREQSEIPEAPKE